jgi:hypothetical protein
MNPESVLGLNAQGGTALDGSGGVLKGPELDLVRDAPVPDVPIRDFWNEIIHPSVTYGAK